MHSKILCDHSDYAQSLPTHGYWKTERSDDGRRRLLILDSNEFSRPIVEELVLACCANRLTSAAGLSGGAVGEPSLTTTTTRKTDVHIPDLSRHFYSAASYLGMKSISFLIINTILSIGTIETIPALVQTVHGHCFSASPVAASGDAAEDNDDDDDDDASTGRIIMMVVKDTRQPSMR